MKSTDVLELIAFLVLLTLVTPILGGFIARVFQGEKTFLHPVLGGCERGIYRLMGVDAKKEMGWKEYAQTLMSFNVVGIGFVFLGQILQPYLPMNGSSLGPVRWDSAINTAVSFVTNTNWQGYSPESTMSNFTQMLFLAVQNFVSAAVGLTVAIAFARGVASRLKGKIGNFWVDLVRGTLYVLMPLSIGFALILISQGVVQTFSSQVSLITLEGVKQILVLGPVASQVAIKMIGTNGGGFYNANAAHPFENSTGLSNFLQMLSIFLIPAALTFTFGSMTKARAHGWILFATMLALFVGTTALSMTSEFGANPALHQAALMEGKETRFGVFNSVLFSTVTTSASCGAVNAMHSSLSPLSGGIAMLNMMLGEIVFGGVGAGLYGMLLFVLMTVFLAGLMVGRTPEYLGKKIEAREITMVIIAILAPCAMILLGTGISVVLPVALSSLGNQGPHGFSEILYAFTSAAANNGSAFAGLNANTIYYNLMLAVAMFVGRFAIIVPVLAVAGSLAAKNESPASLGTFQVDTPLFAILLVGVILIVGALTFLPGLSLGPVVEHLLMLRGQIF